jgi:ribosomal protein L11 methylase PrmA
LCLAPGGRLIASGILRGEAERVVADLVARGLTLVASRDEDDPEDPIDTWRALVLERR